MSMIGRLFSNQNREKITREEVLRILMDIRTIEVQRAHFLRIVDQLATDFGVFYRADNISNWVK